MSVMGYNNLTKKTMTGRTYQNLGLPFQTGTLSNRLTSGSIPMLGNLSYHWLTWVDLSTRNPSKRSTSWMSSPCSIKSSEDWQLGWLRRKESVLMVLIGHTKRAFILSFETKFCFASWTKRHLALKERRSWSNTSGNGPNIYWKVLTTDTKCPDL